MGVKNVMLNFFLTLSCCLTCPHQAGNGHSHSCFQKSAALIGKMMLDPFLSLYGVLHITLIYSTPAKACFFSQFLVCLYSWKVYSCLICNVDFTQVCMLFP